MPISINGSGTISGISVGGLPDGCISEADLSTAAVTTDKIAAGAVTTPKITGGPAFSVYSNATQTVSSLTPTKIALNTEEYDTASAFDSSANYRFQPTVAGYYQLNGIARFSTSSTMTNAYLELWKNGSTIIRGGEYASSTSLSTVQMQATFLIYLNGTSDFVELYGVAGGSGTLQFVFSGYGFTSRFSGFLARPA